MARAVADALRTLGGVVRKPLRARIVRRMDDDARTLTDDEIETVWTAEDARAGAAVGLSDETGDTGDDSGDVSDTSDTGDDSGDDSGDTGDTGDVADA